MQQSKQLDLDTGFFFTDLDTVGGLGVASDLSWRNALVLSRRLSIKGIPVSRGNGGGKKGQVTYLRH
jgi:hypothetical protein